MNENENGFQSSPGSPKPPMRENVPSNPERVLVTQADTSGLDIAGEASLDASHAPMPSSERTESFSSARAGDTGNMLAGKASSAQVENAAVPARQQSAAARNLESGYASQPAPQATYASQSDPRAAYVSQPASQSTYAPQQAPQAPYASQQAQRTYVAPQETSQASYGSQYSRPSVTYSARSSSSAPSRDYETKKSGGAGKSFLFGFLGALLACALAFGGFAFAGGFSGFGAQQPGQNAALIGTTDQSVINAVDEGQTLAEAVASKALPSVVAIYNYQAQQPSSGFGFGTGYGAGDTSGGSLVATGMGSGVVISNEGYIITNYHVVDGASQLKVSVNGAERDAEYIGGDKSSDIAVVKVSDTEGLVPADIGDSDDLKIGEWVMTVGAPLGLESSVATGVVSATNRSTIMNSSTNSNDILSYYYGNAAPEYTYYPNMIQTDAVINPGNSGGALVDANGKLIGINAMISSYSGDYAGVGFAIPINYAINIAKNVIDGKEPTHAIIGVTLSQVNSTIAQQYNLSTDKGAYISAITPDTGAADSDLAIGDIITKVAGKAVTSPNDVTLEVRAHNVGDTITLTVNRAGEEMDIDVVLTSDENMTQAAPSTQDQGQGQEQGQGQGQNPWGGRGSDGQGYTMEELEELLRLLEQ